MGAEPVDSQDLVAVGYDRFLKLVRHNVAYRHLIHGGSMRCGNVGDCGRDDLLPGRCHHL